MPLSKAIAPALSHSRSDNAHRDQYLREVALAGGVLALCILTLILPPLLQDPNYHEFADNRTLFGVPRALDSLSNIGFLVAGLWGLLLVATDRLIFFSPALRTAAVVFFSGFLTTAVGSTYYHLHPDDARLAVDRAGMVVVFAGLLGMAAAQRISDRAGRVMLLVGLVLGPASVVWWIVSGSLGPYAVVQFGGMALVVGMMSAPERGPGPYWSLMLVTYGLAKVCESMDIEIFIWGLDTLSGHTLKHLLAALPVLAVTLALRRTDPEKD